MSSEEKISVKVNGQTIPCHHDITIPELLQDLDLNPERVVVEWNGHAQTREEASSARLSDGDSLEVIRIVAGG